MLNLFFAQNEVRAHYFKSYLNLINSLFGEEMIQNPLNSPDLA